jgi:hypothetical protein
MPQEQHDSASCAIVGRRGVSESDQIVADSLVEGRRVVVAG